MISKIRFICFGYALLFAVSAALGASGEYQSTRDGKTTVWNGNPKPGESASWAGNRDKQGYATGFGTVTWYTAQGAEYATYYGNMVNGKFEGPVNAHVGRQTAHAYFVDGNRETAWARGRAPANMNVPPELVAKRRKAEAEQPKPREERTTAKKEEKRTEAAETVRPIEHPGKPEPKQTPAAVTEKPSKQTPTPAPVAESSVAQTPTPAATAESTVAQTHKPTQSPSAFSEPSAIAATRETRAPVAAETPRISTPEPSVEQKPSETPAAPAESAAAVEESKKSDTSLNALTGPPSTLRSNSLSEMSPTAEPQTRSTATGTRGIAQLSQDEAIGLADTEARARGADLNEYQRPKADYSAVKDKWTLFYNLKEPKMASDDLQSFSVTVEDKTKKVEIRRNY